MFNQDHIKQFLPEWLLGVLLFVILWSSASVIDLFDGRALPHLLAAKDSLDGTFNIGSATGLYGHDMMIRHPLWMAVHQALFTLFGTAPWVARMPAMILSLLNLGLIYCLATQFFGRRVVALVAVAIAGSSWGYVLASVSPLSSMLTLSLHLLYLILLFSWQQENQQKRQRTAPAKARQIAGYLGMLLGLVLLLHGWRGCMPLVGLTLVSFFDARSRRALSHFRFDAWCLYFVIPVVAFLFFWFARFHHLAAFDRFLVFQKALIEPGIKFVWQQHALDFVVMSVPFTFLMVSFWVDINTNRSMLRVFEKQKAGLALLLAWMVLSLGFVVLVPSASMDGLLMALVAMSVVSGVYIGRCFEEKVIPGFLDVSVLVLIVLSLFLTVLWSHYLFQVLPDDYPVLFWSQHFPLLPFSSTLTSVFGFELASPFPLWKVLLVVGPFLLILSGVLFLLLSLFKRRNWVPISLIVLWLVFLLFLKWIALPILDRPVSADFGRALTQQIKTDFQQDHADSVIVLIDHSRQPAELNSAMQSLFYLPGRIRVEPKAETNSHSDSHATSNLEKTSKSAVYLQPRWNTVLDASDLATQLSRYDEQNEASKSTRLYALVYENTYYQLPAEYRLNMSVIRYHWLYKPFSRLAFIKSAQRWKAFLRDKQDKLMLVEYRPERLL